MTPEQNLANAIIIRACDDYRDALKKLKRNPRHKESLKTKTEVEEFFRSDWYEILTSLDGEMLMKKLREEVENER